MFASVWAAPHTDTRSSCWILRAGFCVVGFCAKTSLALGYQCSLKKTVTTNKFVLRLEFATQEGRTYAVERTQGLASGQWEAVTTVEGSVRHEVIEIPTTEQRQVHLRVREVSGIVQ